MEVNIKLEFANRRNLQRMIDWTRKIECPMQDVDCDFRCLYHDSCLKFRDICERLEIADYNESKHSS